MSTDPEASVEKPSALVRGSSAPTAQTREALLIELAKDVIAEFGDTGFAQSVGARLSAKARAALSAPPEPCEARAMVSIKPMALSDGRIDYFVSIKVGDKDVTPHVFREEYKAAYHVALYDWLLNGRGEEPHCIDFGPNDWPAKRTPHSGKLREELIEQEAKRRCEAADYSLDRIAREDRRFRHDDTRPWWQARYVPQIEGLIASVEQAGFVVVPSLPSPGPNSGPKTAPMPVRPYTNMPGASINGEPVYDWLMDDGSIEAMTATDVQKRRASSSASAVGSNVKIGDLASEFSGALNEAHADRMARILLAKFDIRPKATEVKAEATNDILVSEPPIQRQP